MMTIKRDITTEGTMELHQTRSENERNSAIRTEKTWKGTETTQHFSRNGNDGSKWSSHLWTGYDIPEKKPGSAQGQKNWNLLIDTRCGHVSNWHWTMNQYHSRWHSSPTPWKWSCNTVKGTSGSKKIHIGTCLLIELKHWLQSSYFVSYVLFLESSSEGLA